MVAWTLTNDDYGRCSSMVERGASSKTRPKMPVRIRPFALQLATTGEMKWQELELTKDAPPVRFICRFTLVNWSRLQTKLDNAGSGLHRLADRLLGGQPEDDSNKVAIPVPSGAIGDCQDRANTLSRLADEIGFALDRLEQVA